jgi:hypothetical protein
MTMSGTGCQRVGGVYTPALWLFCLVGLAPQAVLAQELVPAAYTPAPVGVNLVTLSGGYSSGDVSFDPSLPVEDASARINALSVSYGRSFGLVGRSATVTVIAPYVKGDLEGVYIGEQTYVERSGPGDAIVRLGVNLFGAPAMDLEAFRRYRPRTLIGTSLIVRAPTGEYDSSKVINIGTNRWGFKPEIGVVQVVGKWAFDAYVGGWYFTDNTDFLGGQTRTQEFIFSTQFHARYFFKRTLWGAADANFWRGGQTAVDGVSNDDLQRNSRVGFTLAWQVAPRHGLRFAASRGAFTRIGGDFESVGVSYSYSWMKKPGSKEE